MEIIAGRNKKALAAFIRQSLNTNTNTITNLYDLFLANVYMTLRI